MDYAFDKAHPQLDGGAIARREPTHFLSYGTAMLITTRLFRIGRDFDLGVLYARPHLPGERGSFRFILSNGL